MDDGNDEAPPSPSSSGVAPAGFAAPPRRERRHWLDYATVVLAGLVFLAASLAAGFSGWQALILSDTAERQLRAYLYVSFNLQLKKNPDGSLTVTVTPSTNVYGVTPAAWISPAWDLKLLPASSLRAQLAAFPIIAGGSDVVEAPGQVYAVGSKNVTLQESDIESLNNHTNVIVIFGRITYNDVFSKQRWTNFCMIFDRDDFTNSHTCPDHNDSDWSGHPPTVSTTFTIKVNPAAPAQKPP